MGITAYLQYLGIDDYILKVVTTPTDAAELVKHQANMKKASSIVMLATSSTHWHLFAGKEDPKNWFDILKAKYEKTGALTAFSYFDKLFGTKFSEGESMVSQLADLDRLQDEANTARIKLSDEYYVLSILHCLPPSYSTLFTALLSTADLS